MGHFHEFVEERESASLMGVHHLQVGSGVCLLKDLELDRHVHRQNDLFDMFDQGYREFILCLLCLCIHSFFRS